MFRPRFTDCGHVISHISRSLYVLSRDITVNALTKGSRKYVTTWWERNLAQRFHERLRNALTVHADAVFVSCCCSTPHDSHVLVLPLRELPWVSCFVNAKPRCIPSGTSWINPGHERIFLKKWGRQLFRPDFKNGKLVRAAKTSLLSSQQTFIISDQMLQ